MYVCLYVCILLDPLGDIEMVIHCWQLEFINKNGLEPVTLVINFCLVGQGHPVLKKSGGFLKWGIPKMAGL